MDMFGLKYFTLSTEISICYEIVYKNVNYDNSVRCFQLVFYELSRVTCKKSYNLDENNLTFNYLFCYRNSLYISIYMINVHTINV